MAEVGLFEAKTHLSKLVEDIESGREKEIILTRRGKPVARLIPLGEPSTKADVRDAFDTFERIRKSTRGPVNQKMIRSWIEEGRR